MMKEHGPTWRDGRRRQSPEIVGQPYFRYLIISMIGIWAVMVWFDYMNPPTMHNRQSHVRQMEREQINQQNNVRQVLMNTDKFQKRPSLDAEVNGKIVDIKQTFEATEETRAYQNQNEVTKAPENDNPVTNAGSTEPGTNSASAPQVEEGMNPSYPVPVISRFEGESNIQTEVILDKVETPLLPAGAAEGVENGVIAKKTVETPFGVNKYVNFLPVLPTIKETDENQPENLHKNEPSMKFKNKLKNVDEIGGEIMEDYDYKISPKFSSVVKQHSKKVEDKQTDKDHPHLSRNYVKETTIFPTKPEAILVFDGHANW